jgi:hypothetical protein
LLLRVPPLPLFLSLELLLVELLDEPDVSRFEELEELEEEPLREELLPEELELEERLLELLLELELLELELLLELVLLTDIDLSPEFLVRRDLRPPTLERGCLVPFFASLK